MEVIISTAGIVDEKFPKAGIRAIVNAGYKKILIDEIENEKNIPKILKVCESADLKIFDTKKLITNQTKNIGGHLVRGKFFDPFEVVEEIDSNDEIDGFNLDVGNANLCGLDMQYFLKIIGNRLKAVTIRDNNGNQDASLLPFTAVNERHTLTDWLNLIRGLRDIDFDGALIIKFADTAAAFSPIIRPELIKLSKTIIDYIAWQIKIESVIKKYKSRVLFGAGNMCRAYMKCYGEKYPPLFTCDNNQKLWNTNFCGLEVKSPDYLKNISDDCAIFICNIYYSEIERQLREMGLKNPIERFNDEYLPSFHFTRI